MSKRIWVALIATAQLGLAACTQTTESMEDIASSAPPVAVAANMPNDDFGSGYNYVQTRTVAPSSYQPATVSPYATNNFMQVSYSPAVRSVAPPAVILPSVQVSQNGMPALSKKELDKIGEQIFKNEGGGNVNNLVHWNDGEDFAAMGIGHFTWYPAGRSQRFGNTFPQLVSYIEQHGVPLPGWLAANREFSPWRSKAELMRVKNTPQVLELRDFLYRTRDIQAKYIVDRARRAMPRLVKAAPEHLRSKVANNLNAVANTPGGWYALIDYVNFKGEGLNRSGGYKGMNWGLLQVLESMQPTTPGANALQSFANAAMYVLERRIRNSPPARGESRWLAGWSNRVNTYRAPLG